MPKRMPPLNPLRSFEVAGRSKSFTEAAAELNVTQVAVSRQVSVLEGYLNIKLFERELSHIRLTEEGRRFHQEISPAFDIIFTATQRLFDAHSGRVIHIQTYPTFLAKWLMPRLTTYMGLNPQTEFQIRTSVKPEAFVTGNYDVAIRYGDGRWPNLEARRLMKDRIAPVGSPRLLPEGLTDPSELKRHHLIAADYRRNDWRDWFAENGLGSTEDVRFIRFESSLLAYEAAAGGLGIAIGQLPLLESEIETGRLGVVIDRPLSRDTGYWLTWPRQRRRSRELVRFIDWLLSLGCPSG